MKAVLYLFLLTIVTPFTIFAQSEIRGQIKDQESKGIAFSNVLLLNSDDSVLVKGAISDPEGKYTLSNISNGEYILCAYTIGYSKNYSEKIRLENSQLISIPTLQLHEDIQELNEVVIQSSKPFFERQFDRTVINVESSITSAGSTVLEVLEKSPGVLVNRQHNSIAMNGKSGVLVMIDGKINQMPISALVEMLDGLSSANIEKIELITSPPAKYDASGSAGIIHIVMKKNSNLGTNGSFGLNLGYAKGENYGGNFNINHRQKGFNFFLNYSTDQDKNEHRWITERTLEKDDFTQYVKSDSKRNPTTTSHNLRTGFEFDLTKKTTVSFLMTGFSRNWDMPAYTENQNQFSPDSLVNTNFSIHEINKRQIGTGSLGITHKLTESQEIQVSFDYLVSKQKNPSDYVLETFINDNKENPEQEFIKVNKVTPLNFKVLKLDYANTVNSKFSFDAGVKGFSSYLTNNVTVDRQQENQVVRDEQLSNYATLDERIMAGYSSLKWNPNENWAFGAGLRYEHTSTYLSTDEQAGLVDRNYGNFFPTLFLHRKLNEDSKFQLAYNKRITRPTFGDLAPFVFFISPETFVAGNLGLKPAISNAFELNYQVKQWWISLKYTNTKDGIAFLQPEINPETNEQFLRSQNLDYTKSYGISATLPISVTNWWEMNNDFSVYLNNFKTTHLENNTKINAYNISLNTVNIFQLPKEYSVELSALYEPKSSMGMYLFKPKGRVNIGVKKQLKNNSGVVTLAANDIFNTSAWRMEANVPKENLNTNINYDWGMRSIKISYTKNFGNKKLKNIKIKSGSEEERKRVE